MRDIKAGIKRGLSWILTAALTEDRLRQIRELNDLAEERGQSLAQMALAWDLRDGAVTSVLIGASKPEQVLNNLQALNNTAFTDEELQKIDRICGL